MQANQIELVRATWSQMQAIGPEAGSLFYARLFEVDPSLRALFTIDLTTQSERLIEMISIAIKGLNRLEALVPALKALGARHAGYGVMDAHYETVGAALLWTLKQGLGSSFTPDVERAWVAVYGKLAATMQSGAREIPLESPAQRVA